MRNDPRYKQALKVLCKIDSLVARLDEVDPYGDLAENFSEPGGDKGIPVTRRLIKMIEDDLRTEPKAEYRLRLFVSRRVVSSQLLPSIEAAHIEGAKWVLKSGKNTYAVSPARNPRA